MSIPKNVIAYVNEELYGKVNRLLGYEKDARGNPLLQQESVQIAVGQVVEPILGTVCLHKESKSKTVSQPLLGNGTDIFEGKALGGFNRLTRTGFIQGSEGSMEFVQFYCLGAHSPREIRVALEKLSAPAIYGILDPLCALAEANKEDKDEFISAVTGDNRLRELSFSIEAFRVSSTEVIQSLRTIWAARKLPKA